MAWTIQSGEYEFKGLLDGSASVSASDTFPTANATGSCSGGAGFIGLSGSGHAKMKWTLTNATATENISVAALSSDQDSGVYHIKVRQVGGTVIDSATIQCDGTYSDVSLNMSGNAQTTVVLEVTASGKFSSSRLSGVGKGGDLGLLAGVC